NGTKSTFAYDAMLRQTGIDVTIGGSSPPSCEDGVWCPPTDANARASSSLKASILAKPLPDPDPSPRFVASLHEAFGSDSIVRLRQRKFGTAAPLTDVYQVDGDGRVTAEALRQTNITLPVGEADDSIVSSYIRYGTNWRYFDVDADGNWRSTAT